MRRAMEGGRLCELARMAMSVLREAQRRTPRSGPGRPPEYSGWQMATMIALAVAKQRKTKSAQYRYLFQHRVMLMRLLGLASFPSRSTFFQRYTVAWRLFQEAIVLQGRRMAWADARVVAVDKSLVPARGRPWHQRHRLRRPRSPPRGVDPEADWGYSPYSEWVYGYSFEVVVTATPGGVAVPLAASVGPASASEHRTFARKIPALPSQTRYVLADSGYDSNRHGEAVEYDGDRRTGRRLLCPPVRRPNDPEPGQPYRPERHRARRKARARRLRRLAFFNSRRGRRLYRQRSRTVEPFNEWFKNLLDLHGSVWHLGLGNNATQILAGIFLYQLLLRYNRRAGAANGQIQWILDGL